MRQIPLNMAEFNCAKIFSLMSVDDQHHGYSLLTKWKGERGGGGGLLLGGGRGFALGLDLVVAGV